MHQKSKTCTSYGPYWLPHQVISGDSVLIECFSIDGFISPPLTETMATDPLQWYSLNSILMICTGFATTMDNKYHKTVFWCEQAVSHFFTNSFSTIIQYRFFKAWKAFISFSPNNNLNSPYSAKTVHAMTFDYFRLNVWRSDVLMPASSDDDIVFKLR